MVIGNDAGDMLIEDRIGHLIKRAEQALISTKSRVLREAGLTVPQYSALLVLSQRPGISGAELARRCFVTPQSMATLLGTLEQKGLVHREPSTIHSQVLVTKLTRSGHNLLRKADRLAVAVERALADTYTAEELHQLRALLTAAVTTLDSFRAAKAPPSASSAAATPQPATG